MLHPKRVRHFLIYRFKFIYLSGRNLLSKALAYSLHCTKNALATIKLAKAFFIKLPNKFCNRLFRFQVYRNNFCFLLSSNISLSSFLFIGDVVVNNINIFYTYSRPVHTVCSLFVEHRIMMHISKAVNIAQI